MKKTAITLAAAMLSAVAFSEGQKLVVSQNGSKSLEPGFQVEKFQVIGPRDLVSVDVDGGIARVTGLKAGKCSVKVSGGGNMEEVYEIEVGDDIAQIQRNLQAELDEVPGVEITKVGSSLLVRGEINDPDGWRLLKKTVAHGDYAHIVKDQTKFRVQADTLKNFYQQLRDANFQLVDKPQDAKDGKLYVKYDGNMVLINGTVFSSVDVERLDRIIAAQAAWLKFEEMEKMPDPRSPSTPARAPTAMSPVAALPVAPVTAPGVPGANGTATAAQEKDDDWRPVCRRDVGVDHTLLHMDVVIVGYTETSAKDYGTGDKLSISGAFHGLWDLVAGKAENDTFQIDADLGAVLGFLKENGITRHSTGGYLRFKCNDEDTAKLKIGGTLNVKMKGQTTLGAAMEQFEKIEYGFIVTSDPAHLVDRGNADIRLNVSQKKPVPMSGGYEEGYNIEEFEYNPAIVCPLGKTVVISGYRNFSETTKPLAGMPVLRNVPILGWFFSNDKEQIEDGKLMMLVSVREVRPDEPEVQNAKLPYDECKDLTTEVDISNKERIEARKRWHGLLYWLNWFTP